MTPEELTLVMQNPFKLPNYAATVEDMIGRAIRKAVRRERCKPKKIENATNTRIWPEKTLAYVSEVGAVTKREGWVYTVAGSPLTDEQRSFYEGA